MSTEKQFELIPLTPPTPYWAARIRPLGLTAYGDTPQDAVDKLVLMVTSWVNVQASRSGVEL